MRINACGAQRDATVSVGARGAAVAATWSPTRTDWPGARVDAQSLPAQVIDFFGTRVQFRPQELTMAVAVVSGHVTVHPDALAPAVTTSSAT